MTKTITDQKDTKKTLWTIRHHGPYDSTNKPPQVTLVAASGREKAVAEFRRRFPQREIASVVSSGNHPPCFRFAHNLTTGSL